MFKYIRILCVIVFPAIINAQNIALHKRYVLSTLPNYQFSAPASDSTSLTDGTYTNGFFWTKKTTVGWQNKQVSVNIDLSKLQSISSVGFNTVRSSQAGVNFPANIYVFISNDNQNFIYVGDAADDSSNTPGPYEVKKFVLNNINMSARYVYLSIIPNGNLIFCDEIEIGKAGVSTARFSFSTKSNLIRKEVLNQTIDSLKSSEFDRKSLNKEVNHLISNAKGNDIKTYNNINAQLEKKDISDINFGVLHNKVGKLHAAILNNKYKEPFIVERYNPWDNLPQMSYPDKISSVLNYDFVLPEGGSVQYGAFVITNITDSSQQYKLTTRDANSFTNTIDVFEVPFVPSLNFTKMPDPIIPVMANISIGSGISKMFIFRVNGEKSGFAKSTITVASANKEIGINISVKVTNIPYLNLTSGSNINTNVWAYLNYPMLKDRVSDAVEDLKLHRINTIVIPPTILPNMDVQDYSVLQAYLRNFQYADNVLLFMNYSSSVLKNGYSGGIFMSTAWKIKFLNWYNKTVKCLRENGFPNAQILLYPYDEVNGKDINDFKNLVTWAKGSIRGVKFYATLYDSIAIETILPLIDIGQIQTKSYPLRNLPPHYCDIWIYSAIGPSRALSPYSFYRLMSWNAFVNDYKGIGFWNYADEGPYKKLNLISDLLPSPSNDYSVIYNAPNGSIISSRRWEAFRLGIEDYSILQAYSKKYGIQNAKAMATQVVNDPQDLNLADSVRNKMLMSLSGNN